jgi:hypothetical protein
VQPLTPLTIGTRSYPYDYEDGASADGITWRRGFARVDVLLQNKNSVPLGDMLVQIDSDLFIFDASCSSSLADAKIGPSFNPINVTVIAQGSDGREVATGFDADGEHQQICQQYRLTTPRLPPGAEIRVNLAIVAPAPALSPELYARERPAPARLNFVISYSAYGEHRHDTYSAQLQ